MPTATRPVAAPTRAPSPTATTSARTTPVARPTQPAPPGGYAADFSAWTLGETPGESRRTFDRASGEYQIAILEDDWDLSYYAPEGQTFTDFTLEVDARRVAGPDAGGYGLVFRRQPKGANDESSVRYVFYVTPQGLFSAFLYNADGTTKTIQSLTSSPAIKVGDSVNHLSVTCRGNSLTLAINGQTVGSYTIAVVQPGEIGVFATAPKYATGVEVAFRNLRLTPAR